jgi:hypothetical protein
MRLRRSEPGVRGDASCASPRPESHGARSVDSLRVPGYALLKMRSSRNLEEAEAVPEGGCEDVRCGCGSLLARVIEGAVELKCRRCKRVWRLPVDGASRALDHRVRIDGR